MAWAREAQSGSVPCFEGYRHGAPVVPQNRADFSCLGKPAWTAKFTHLLRLSLSFKMQVILVACIYSKGAGDTTLTLITK